MKTRIIHTKIYEDEWFVTLTPEQKFLFIYLFTNYRIGLTGIYQITDRIIRFETGLSQQVIDKAKQVFQAGGRVIFYKDWVYVVNASRYGGYTGEKNKVAYEKELNSIPEEIKKYLIDRVSIGYQYPIDTPINHKSEIINNNRDRDREIIREKEKEKEKEIKEKEKEIIDFFNQQHNTKYKTIGVSENNLKFWLDKYSIEEIKQAIILIKAHNFWAGKMTPTILFRTKGQSGQPVDYIGQLLNQPKPEMKPNEQYGEYTKRLEIWKTYGKSK